MVNTIKVALEHELALRHFEDEETVRTELTQRVEKLCRALRVSGDGKAQLLEHIEVLLEERIHKVKTPQ